MTTRTVESAYTPAYTEQGTVTLMVKFAEIPSAVPFHAMPTDPVPYGVDLYNRAIAGEFGEIAPYVPPAETRPARKTVEQMFEELSERLTKLEQRG